MPVKKKPTSPAPRRLITLMLVDDHPLWRKMLKKVMDNSRVAKVVAEAGNGEEAVEIANKINPDIALMDIDLPVMNGIEATRRLNEAGFSTKVLVLAASDEKSRVLNAVRAGAKGYLLKTAGPKEILDAIRRVHHGELVFPAELADLVLEELKAPTPSARERLRVVLGDSSLLFREGLSRVLTEAGFDVAASVGTRDQLNQVSETDPPDVFIVDLELADLPDRSDVGLLVLSQDVDAGSAIELLGQRSKGIGYLLKDRVSDVRQLVDAIERVAAGESVIDSEVATSLATAKRAGNPLGELTDREREILELMAEGRSNQAISEQLFLTPKTVEGHIGHIFSKLGLEPTQDEHRRVVAVLTYLRSA